MLTTIAVLVLLTLLVSGVCNIISALASKNHNGEAVINGLIAGWKAFLFLATFFLTIRVNS